MGALNFLMNAMAPAAEAVGGYSQGQEQEHDKQRAEGIQDQQLRRQSKLDDIESQLKTSQADEARARSAWFNRPPPINRNIVQGDDGSEYLVDEKGVATPISTPAGVPVKGMPKAKTETSQQHVIDPVTGAVTFFDPKNPPKGLKVGVKPTKDPNDPAPMNAETKDAYLAHVANRFIIAANGDPEKAAELSIQDPTGLAAYQQGLSSSHFQEAAKRYARGEMTDKYNAARNDALYGGLDNGAPPGTTPTPGSSPAQSPVAAAVPPRAISTTPKLDAVTKKPAAVAPAVTPAPAAPRAAAPVAPKTAPSATPKLDRATDPLANDPDVQTVLNLVKTKRATLDDVDGSTSLSKEQKAAVHRLVGSTR